VPSAVFDKLNEQQRAAATHSGQHASVFDSPPLLIIAGAGTGKTNTLAHRVAHLVLEGVDPQRILLLTFTRRAALEMTRRAQKIVGEAFKAHRASAVQSDGAGAVVRLPWSGTFHSIANRLIRRYAASVGLDESFSVLDRGDAADLIDLARHELGFSREGRRFPRKDTCLAIYSHRVNTRGSLEDTLATVFPWCAEWQAELTALFRAYVERKLSSQALDYDDLLLYWHAMMEDERLAREVDAQFDHILVDEYQDTNVLQAETLQRLRPDGRGLTVVGDDAQAIYSFRAATVENILGFPAQYPGTERHTLEENYRSTQAILDAANALIGEGAHQYRKNLRSRKKDGGGNGGTGGSPVPSPKPRYVTVSDDRAQAEYVVSRVLDARERGMLLRRQAVLFRSSHHSDVLELELVRRNIPYVKYGGLKFLEAAHVKDLLSVLRWADNPKNRVAAFRALQLSPGVGPALAERAFARFEALGHAWTALASGSEETDRLLCFLGDPATPWAGQLERVRAWYEPLLERLYDAAPVRAGDLAQLERIAAGFETRERFLTEMALDPPQATSDLAGTPYLDEDYLVLSTVHSAKGQEWDAVHVLNVSDGNFPLEFATGRADLVEEERRLLYVAMTRAKRELSLIAPLRYYVTQQPRMGDRHVYGAQSRFLTAAVMQCLEPVTFGEAYAAEKPAATRARVDVASRLRGMW
jgi:DNA helicase-2/ATP-dependent DNA helicase PcrA